MSRPPKQNTDLPPDADEMNRSELQRALRNWGLPSGGTNVALRERYKTRMLQLGQVGNGTGGNGKQQTVQTKKNGHAVATAAGTATTASKKKPSSAKKVEEQETRLKRFRKSCPSSVWQRLERAKTQKLFLVRKGEIVRDEGDDYPSSCEFVVLGSTGNVYTVTIRRLPKCTCPDHAKGNTLCKHVLFVLLKVMAVPKNSPLVYQAAWIGSELQQLFGYMERRFRQVSGCNIMANAAVQKAFAKLENGEKVDDDDDDATPRRAVGEDDDCPICFDPLQGGGDTTFCRSQCGANFHTACIRKWLQQHRTEPTCPMCRQEWQDDAEQNKEGFTNFGKLQGQSRTRDRSTYSEWMGYDAKRRRY